jgi:hypothetical protein
MLTLIEYGHDLTYELFLRDVSRQNEIDAIILRKNSAFRAKQYHDAVATLAFRLATKFEALVRTVCKIEGDGIDKRRELGLRSLGVAHPISDQAALIQLHEIELAGHLGLDKQNQVLSHEDLDKRALGVPEFRNRDINLGKYTRYRC